MSKCGNCSVELRFGNTPIRGSGKLASGETICLDCFRKLVKLELIASVKKYSLAEVTAKLAGIHLATQRIKDQLERSGLSTASSLWNTKEMAELPYIIREDEAISGLLQGVNNGGSGILVATNKRLLFMDKELFYGLKVQEYKLGEISSVQYEGNGINIALADDLIRISHVEKHTARLFCDLVTEKLEARVHSKAPAVIQRLVPALDKRVAI